MEDAMALVPEFMAVACERFGGCAATGACKGEISHVRFFGVYDGHGGSQVRVRVGNSICCLVKDINESARIEGSMRMSLSVKSRDSCHESLWRKKYRSILICSFTGNRIGPTGRALLSDEPLS